MFRREPDRLLPWAIGAGAAAGVGVAAYTILRLVRQRRRPAPVSELEWLEESAVEALRRDRVTGACAIDVAALNHGVVELSGSVPSHETGQRAARLLHALPGVTTVVNRLQVGTLEERLAENRHRHEQGEPALRDRRWYGVRVGTGRRRQSFDTEPGRPDDTVERITKDLDVHPHELPDTTAEPLNGEPNSLPH